MRERFSQDNWAQLQRLPIMMFHFVSLADKKMQEEEVSAFVSELHDALLYKDPLHRDLFTDLMDPTRFKKAFSETVRVMSDSVKAIDGEFKSAKKILNKVLDSDEYNRFFVSLTGTGLKVASAAGDGPNRISKEEAAAIAIFLSKFAVDIDAGKAALSRL